MKGTRLQRKRKGEEESSMPWKLFRSINTLKLRGFLDCYCDKNLQSLVIEGEPTPEALNECWEEILEQYNDAIGGVELTAKTDDVRELLIMDSEISIAWTLIKVIEAGNCEDEFVAELYKLGYDLPALTDDNILRVIAVLKSKLKRTQIDFDALAKKVKPEESKAKAEVKISRIDFYRQFVAFSEMFGGALLREDVDNTSQYCAYVSTYNERIESMKKRNAKWQSNK